jgi:hypothetical protein
MADPVIAFTGDPQGNFHQGIPARDLSGAEYDALDNEQRATVRASRVYDYGAYRDAVALAGDRTAKAKEAPAKDTPK